MSASFNVMICSAGLSGCRFVTSFVTVFATVIAITKDLPDVEGDRRYNIDTLATRFGPRVIAFTGDPLCSLRHALAVKCYLFLLETEALLYVAAPVKGHCPDQTKAT